MINVAEFLFLVKLRAEVSLPGPRDIIDTTPAYRRWRDLLDLEEHILAAGPTWENCHCAADALAFRRARRLTQVDIERARAFICDRMPETDSEESTLSDRDNFLQVLAWIETHELLTD